MPMCSAESLASTPSAPLSFAVVGGGLTGLAACHRLLELSRSAGRPIRITMCEPGRPGGVIGTESTNGFLVENGADSFITNKPWGVDLVRRLGLESQLIPTDARYRGALVLHEGKPVAVPLGFSLMVPSRIRPMLTTPLLSTRGKLRLLGELFVPARRNQADESLASFVRRRFGQEALDRLVQPLVSGIYTSDPEKLGLRATMPRFLDTESEQGSLIRAALRERKKKPTAQGDAGASGARYGLFVGLRDGMSTLLDTLTERNREGGVVHRNAEVTAVRQNPATNSWSVQTSPGELETFDGVVIATPAYRAAGLLRETSVSLADRLDEIEYASSAIVVTAHRLDDVAHPLDSFGLVIPTIERRKIIAVSFSSRKFPDRAPEGHVLLRTFVGGAMQPELFELDDEAMLSTVRRELADILGVSGDPLFSRVVRYPRAMPQYHVGHAARVEAIEAEVGSLCGLELAGNAYRGVGVPDCIHSAEQAVERIWPAVSERAASPAPTLGDSMP